MELNKKKNIIVCIAALFLFVALIDGLPYGFFTLLRFVVFAMTAYVAWIAYEQQKEKWIWIFGFLAVLFNPFFPIYLNRGLWSIIDLLTGLFLVVSIFVLKFARKS
ncbi:MAG: hypothetical protein K9M10_03280 [Candidatus Pacebacteria bacterium]|nr:hypothetical protein [Candidatus Paceibacterota bacterium]MCF7857477.1 hypothetical protein [Candidatus Paceibacterota bacterium]